MSPTIEVSRLLLLGVRTAVTDDPQQAIQVLTDALAGSAPAAPAPVAGDADE